VAVRYRLEIDPICCTGEGLCAALFPEGIRLDDWGYPIIEPGALTRRDLVHARRAVAACPVLALKLVKERTAEDAGVPQPITWRSSG
jgi:ferredoxin